MINGIRSIRKNSAKPDVNTAKNTIKKIAKKYSEEFGSTINPIGEKVNQKNFYDEALLNTLLKKVGRDPYVEPNFRCFLGSRIELGDEVFLNHDVTLQDMAEITIGNNVNIAPRTGIFTEFCPKEKELRRKKIRYAKPVVIEDGVWLGGNVTVWGGVTIGKNSIIGAGSVVTADIPENVIAVGNPAKVIKKIEAD